MLIENYVLKLDLKSRSDWTWLMISVEQFRITVTFFLKMIVVIFSPLYYVILTLNITLSTIFSHVNYFSIILLLFIMKLYQIWYSLTII